MIPSTGELTSALSGIRIIDFTHVFQGPVATQLLADFGADVIKVERPGAGDWSRSWGPYIEGVSMPYASLNRNKRSLAVDLKAASGRQIILRLLEKADVLVHNFRSGTMEKLGLGYDALKASHPHLIYAYSSGWGTRGHMWIGADLGMTSWRVPKGDGSTKMIQLTSRLRRGFLLTMRQVSCWHLV
jgi:crotonobetainyl-CoA:carnitine CoA-transferase CaiB-like acyl-CoA transferase